MIFTVMKKLAHHTFCINQEINQGEKNRKKIGAALNPIGISGVIS